jgi:hypothetical protein
MTIKLLEDKSNFRFLIALLIVLVVTGCNRRTIVNNHALPPNLESGNLASSYSDSMNVLADAVVFFYQRDLSGNLTPQGTGFLVGIPSVTKKNTSYIYLVTARHMVDGPWMGCPSKDHLVLRLNKAFDRPQVLELGERTAINFSLDGQVWEYPDDSMYDLAFTRLPEKVMNALGAVVRPMKLENFATQAEADQLRVGDNIVSAGLLVGASGEWRNFPVFKWGQISSVRSGEPLSIPSPCPGKPRWMREILVAASLVPGNSGSPIVVLPSQFHPGRTFVAGVQSISFMGNDVAGMAPIRPMLDKLRRINGDSDLDLGPPDAPPLIRP